MAARKLYIGRKVREIRDTHKATQAAFAERIGISTSYLNQIENNQRPVSASVLLALAENFQIDIGAMSLGDDDRLLSALTEALTDPIFDSYKPSLQELKLVTQNAPGTRPRADRLPPGLSTQQRTARQLRRPRSARASSSAEPTPYEEVRDFFHFVDNYIHDLDLAAEKLAGAARHRPSATRASCCRPISETRHKVRIARAEPDDDIIRRFDPAARVLYLNPYSPASTRNFQIAFQIAELEMEAQVDGDRPGAPASAPPKRWKSARSACATISPGR